MAENRDSLQQRLRMLHVQHIGVVLHCYTHVLHIDKELRRILLIHF